MDTKNGKQISISFRVDGGVVERNNRDFIAKNVDKDAVYQRNICESSIKSCSRKSSYILEYGEPVSDKSTSSQTVNRKPKKFGRH